jgi:hypothetical protein
MRCVGIQVHETEIEALIRKGYLEQQSRNDRNALAYAVSCFINDALMPAS